MSNPCNVLKITDGTTSVNLINPAYGIHLAEWNPQIQQPKGGGVFQDSPLAPGRHRVYSQAANAIEPFEFKVDGLTQNQVIGRLTTLIGLLEAAVEYAEEISNSTPIYLEMQSEGGNTQYALIESYTFPELDNPFGQPFLPLLGGNSAMDELTLDIERGSWLEYAPNNSASLTTLSIKGGTEYLASSYSIAHWANTGLEYIFVDDGGVFSANQVASTSFNLLPATPAVNDAVYFGNTDIQVHAIVVDLVSVFNGNGSWEYWTGATWTSVGADIQDDTGGLDTLGINSVSFSVQDVSMATTVNSVMAYWIRFRVTSTGAPGTATQQNRIVYQPTWPYIQTNNALLLGDMTSLIKAIITMRADDAFTALYGFMFGARQTSRGDDFSAYINLGNVQMPTDVTTSVTGFGDSSFATLANSAVLTVVQYNPSMKYTSYNSIVSVSIANGEQYTGEFYVFLRYSLQGTSTTYNLRLRTNYGSIDTYNYAVSSTETVSNPGLRYVEFGKISIMPDHERVNPGASLPILFVISATNDNTTHDIYLHDLILIPTDEMAIRIQTPNPSSSNGIMSVDTTLDLNGLLDLFAIVIDTSSGASNDRWRVLANEEFALKPTDTQRIWWLDYSPNAQGNVSSYQALLKTILTKSDRYLGLRGDR